MPGPGLSSGDRLRIGGADARVLVTEGEIRERVGAIGDSLRARLGKERPIFIGLLNGGFVFLADLIRSFGAPHEIDFLRVSRYDPRRKDPTAVRVVHDLRSHIRERTVVVVEGIRARGTKIEYIDRFLQLHRPARIEYVAMVRPAGGNAAVPMSEAGFSIGGEFVLGYGLDQGEQYRHLPFLCALENGATPSPRAGR